MAGRRRCARARPERVYLWGAEWRRRLALRSHDRYWALARRLLAEE